MSIDNINQIPSQTKSEFNIDFVLPWVDGADKKWLAQKQKYLPKTAAYADSMNNSRYQDLGTLRYVLRSIEKNCPWFHKIYLITEGHYPAWLNIHHPKIQLVTHQELFIEPENLPVFNSSAIEMNLVNLKKLSEHFVYLNDDTLIIKKTNPERFFQAGLPVDFLCHGWLKRNALFKKLRGNSAWVNALNNNIDLINQAANVRQLDQRYLFDKSYSSFNKISNFLLKYCYKHYFWFEHWHLPQAYCKQTLANVYQSFSNEILACTKNRFRAPNDLTIYLNRYWHLAQGQFFPKKYHDGVVKNIASIQELKKIINEINANNQVRFICLNDTFNANTEIEMMQFTEILHHFLNQYLSSPASFELTHE